ncbi:MAG: competence protein ComEC, partial [Acidobacteriaceae bacterium]|nr:competence protein ComEC [Acidobacteriaceae bacterium]
MMLRRVLALLFAGVVSLAAVQAQSSAGKLRVYFVDVEGGQATLFVTPDEHSLLIDTGWPGNNGRDADRIVAAAKSAGLSRIDDVLITHYHDDHVGGVPQLAARMPIGAFIVHGPNRELDGTPQKPGV